MEVETMSKPPERFSRFKSMGWVKRLASLKHSSSTANGPRPSKSKSNSAIRQKSNSVKKNKSHSLSPSGRKKKQSAATTDPANEHHASVPAETSIDHSQDLQVEMPSSHRSQGNEYSSSADGADVATPTEECNRSTAPTFGTNQDTLHSDTGQSKTGTTATATGGMSSKSGGENSVFSSPNHSSKSLTTTLTTIQSSTTTGQQNQAAQGQPTSNSHHNPQGSTSSQYFSHQYPTAPAPASAIPSYLNPQHTSHIPTTYRSATANNLLTDNASILTLASSRNRRDRRNSVDTDASVRAIPPSSAWGGSRESLPLSTLSMHGAESIRGGVESSSTPATPGASGNPLNQATQSRVSVGAMPNAERGSLYSMSGVAAPALSSERNSVYAGRASSIVDGPNVRTPGADGGSMRSGMMGHSRNDSVAGSIGGPAPSK